MMVGPAPAGAPVPAGTPRPPAKGPGACAPRQVQPRRGYLPRPAPFKMAAPLKRNKGGAVHFTLAFCPGLWYGASPAQASRQAKGRQVVQAPKKGIKGPVLAGGPQPPALQCRG